MSDYGSDSGYSDQDWLYVEDHYDIVDELVEHTCPSPGPQYIDGTQEYDPYDYWEDLTYLSDGIYDKEDKTRKRKYANTTGTKRKAETQETQRPAKRRRAEVDRPKQSPNHVLHKQKIVEPLVLWKSHQEQEAVTTGTFSRKERLGEHGVSILADWKERFADEHDLADPTQSEPQPQSTTANDMSGEGFDLGKMESVLELLGSDSIETLKSILSARGLDPDAVQAVLHDLLSGQEPSLVDDDESEDDNERAKAGDEEDVGELPKDDPQSLPHLRSVRTAVKVGHETADLPSKARKQEEIVPVQRGRISKRRQAQ